MTEPSDVNPGERKTRGKRKQKRKTEFMTDEWIESKREDVVGMARLGMTDEELADILRIAESALQKHFRLELDTGRAEIRMALRKAQLEKALQEKCTKMLIWLGKMYLGQREPKNEVDVFHNMKIEPTYYGEMAAEEAKKRHKDS